MLDYILNFFSNLFREKIDTDDVITNQTGGMIFGEDHPKAFIILGILASLVAMVLAWLCNSNHNALVRIFITVIAGLCHWPYLVYYFIYHILIGVACSGSSGFGNILSGDWVVVG